MKIALCLYGQPRFINECSPYILNNLCEGYDVDVFFHFWFDKKLQTQPYKYGGDGGWQNQRISTSSIEDALKIYNPKSYKVEESKSFKDSTLHTDYAYYPKTAKLVPWSVHWHESGEPDYINRIVNNNMSYHYSVNQVNLLRKEYEYANDFKYDWVVKVRSDAEPRQKIYYENYDINVVNYTGIYNQPDGMIQDWLNFGGSKCMDIFMSTFNYIEILMEKCREDFGGAWCNEMLHRKALDLFNIDHQPHPLLITLPRF